MWNQQQNISLNLQYSANEKTLWSGVPKRGIIFTRYDLLMIPFGIGYFLWIYFFFNGFFADFGPVRWILMSLFTLQGIYIFIGRFFINAWQRSKTEYAVTNERVIISSGILNKTTESLNLKTIYDISLKEKTDRTGTISFGSEVKQSFWDNNKAPEPLKFEYIPDAKRVYDIIIEAQSNLRKA